MFRRNFLRGLFAAPAVVTAASLMPISARALGPPVGPHYHIQPGMAQVLTIDRDGKWVEVQLAEQINNAMLYRTMGPWGDGAGRCLTPFEVDNNFFELAMRLERIEKMLRGSRDVHLQRIGWRSATR